MKRIEIGHQLSMELINLKKSIFRNTKSFTVCFRPEGEDHCMLINIR